MNWVKARAGCTTRSIFQQLRDRVKADVDEALSELVGDRLEFVDDAPDYFFVRSEGRPAVTFQRRAECISVHCLSSDIEFYLKHRWDDDIDACILTVDDAPLELWQVSKKALSRLIFG